MKSSGKREKTIYDDSLTRIFLWSGFTMFMVLLIACIIIGITVLFYRRTDSEGIKIILFCLALVVPCSYGILCIVCLRHGSRNAGSVYTGKTGQITTVRSGRETGI